MRSRTPATRGERHVAGARRPAGDRAGDRNSLPGAGWRPARFQLSCGCRDQHEEDFSWMNICGQPSRRSLPGSLIWSASWRSGAPSTKVMSRAFSTSCAMPFVIPAASRRLLRSRHGLGGSSLMRQIAFRFRRSDQSFRRPLRLAHRAGSMLSTRSSRSRGYMSGRRSCFDTPVAASTFNTYSGGRALPRLIHFQTACCETPINRPKAACDPIAPTAALRATTGVDSWSTTTGYNHRCCPSTSTLLFSE